MTDDEQVLSLVIERAEKRLEGQLRDSDAADAKALGLLGADAVVLGVIVGVHGALNHLWAVPAFVLGAGGLVLLGVVWPRKFDVGPEPAAFYLAYGAAKLAQAQRQMLSELLAAIAWNERFKKIALLKQGALLILLGLIGAVVVGLVG